MKTNFSILATAIRKLVIILVMGSVAVCAFATLGEGNLRKEKSKKSLLSAKSPATPGIFSLRSGYMFRGNQVIDFKDDNTYISLNTVITYQQGNTTYILPLKKKVILNNKITFNPNAATRQ